MDTTPMTTVASVLEAKKDEFKDFFFYVEHPEEMLSPWSSNKYFTPILVAHVVIFLVGFCSNAFVLGVTASEGFKTPRDNKPADVFLVSLMVADMLLIMIVSPLEVSSYFLIDYDQSGVKCKFTSFLKTTSVAVSVLNLTAMSIER
jgi:hypothetical protein